MNDDNLDLLFQVIALCEHLSGYKIDDDLKYINDSEILDCKFKLYMTLLVDSEEEAKKRFEEFKIIYLKLSKVKRKYIKEHLIRMLEEEKKEKEKIL